jgi:hypothetical protein
MYTNQFTTCNPTAGLDNNGNVKSGLVYLFDEDRDHDGAKDQGTGKIDECELWTNQNKVLPKLSGSGDITLSGGCTLGKFPPDPNGQPFSCACSDHGKQANFDQPYQLCSGALTPADCECTGGLQLMDGLQCANQTPTC